MFVSARRQYPLKSPNPIAKKTGWLNIQIQENQTHYRRNRTFLQSPDKTGFLFYSLLPRYWSGSENRTSIPYSDAKNAGSGVKKVC